MGLGSSHLLQTLRMMRSYRRVGRGRILEFQNACLRRLVAHAYGHVPYYRRLFDRNGINPQDIRTVGDLRAIPITEKNDLRDVPVADTVARGVDPGGLESSRTSGSSGEPFTIRSTWLEARIWCLLWARAMR
ncbi:MAG: hypothetical protein QGH74_07515 [Candidatus Brocadiia bacterium]|nr:hypothetical protein [Candidatus Brocadiia bacterium]